jgi:3-methyl-2-oxobutanoate hydroxymethyltransferase
MENVFTQYRDEVKSRVYPGPEHTVYMNDEQVAKFAKEMNWETKLAELDAAKS